MKSIVMKSCFAVALMGILSAPMLLAHYTPSLVPSLPGCAIDSCNLVVTENTNPPSQTMECVNGPCPTPTNACGVIWTPGTPAGAKKYQCDCGTDQHCSLFATVPAGGVWVSKISCEIGICNATQLCRTNITVNGTQSTYKCRCETT